MTRTVNLDEARNQLPDLIAISSDGGEVIITDKGKPVARLVAIGSRKRRVAGLNRGDIWTSEDFDDPIPNEFWMGNK